MGRRLLASRRDKSQGSAAASAPASSSAPTRRASFCRRGTARASRDRRPSLVRQVGPRSPSARRRNITRSRRCLRAFVHGSRATQAKERRVPAPTRRRRPAGGERLLGERERAEPATASSPQGRGGAVEAQFILRSRSRLQRIRLDVVEREGGGGRIARRSGAAGDFADGEGSLASQRIMGLERSPPVRWP